MKPFPPLVYFGSDDFSAGVLERLVSHDDFQSALKYVVTKTPRISGRGRQASPTAVEKVARDHTEASLIYADNRAELDAALLPLGIEKDSAMGVLVSYGVIVSEPVLNLFSHGITNFHPSLLPADRGPSPVETALLRGDTTLGLSVMRLVPAMDAGPVYDRTTFSIRGDEARDEVYGRIIEDGSQFFYSTLRKIAGGTADATDQDDSKATYTRLIKKQDGEFRPDLKSAEELEREVRVFLGFPKSRFSLLGHPVIITKSHVVSSIDDGPLVIACSGDTYLSIDELIAPSGRKMDAAAFRRGYAAA